MSSYKAIIYLLTNTINGKRYVGFTTNLLKRMSGHQTRAKAGTHGFLLANSIRKHGWEAFTCTILAEHEDIGYAKTVLEPHYIREMDTYHENGKGYNMTWGGEGTLGYRRTPEQCEAMSQRMKANPIPLTEERRAQLREQTSGESNPNYGKTHSPETRAKISAGIKIALAEGRGRGEWTPERRAKAAASQKGKIRSADTLTRMSVAQRGKPGRSHTEEHKAYMRGVMLGRDISQQSINKGRLSKAKYFWIIESPEGLIYETYSLARFCVEHPVNSKTIEGKWQAKQAGVSRRKGSSCWEPHLKIAITEETRESFKNSLDSCWRIVSTPPCTTISDSSQGVSSDTTSLASKTST